MAVPSLQRKFILIITTGVQNVHESHCSWQVSPLTMHEWTTNGMSHSSGALTFGTFPALVVGGKGVLNQTQAIARYVGHLTNICTLVVLSWLPSVMRPLIV